MNEQKNHKVFEFAFEDTPELMIDKYYIIKLDLMMRPEEEFVVRTYCGTLEEIGKLINSLDRDEWNRHYYESTIAACSHYSAIGAASEATQGYTNVQRLHALAAAFDEKAEGYASFLKEKLAAIAVKERLVLSVTAAAPIDFKTLFAALPKGGLVEIEVIAKK